jgi:hypothetical protein
VNQVDLVAEVCEKFLELDKLIRDKFSRDTHLKLYSNKLIRDKFSRGTHLKLYSNGSGLLIGPGFTLQWDNNDEALDLLNTKIRHEKSKQS